MAGVQARNFGRDDRRVGDGVLLCLERRSGGVSSLAKIAKTRCHPRLPKEVFVVGLCILTVSYSVSSPGGVRQQLQDPWRDELTIRLRVDARLDGTLIVLRRRRQPDRLIL